MREDIREYARIGLVHHLLYSDSLNDPRDHLKTLEAFVTRSDIDTFDCCFPLGQPINGKLISAIKNSGKEDIVVAPHLFPLKRLALTSTVAKEQAEARSIFKNMVEQAAAVGATGFIVASGGPSPAEATRDNYKAFAEFCLWLCAQCKVHNIDVLLEPFDTAVDKKYLYGALDDCPALVESLSADVDNFGIELDFAHVPLMGESFEEAVLTTAPYLKRVHLGNCVIKDKQSPLYGDKHPPIGIEGGEIDIPELAQILSELLKVGFLSKARRGSLLLEITPFPGRSEDDSVCDNMHRLEQAWKQADFKSST